MPRPFRQRAHIKSLEEYERIYRESVEQPEKFWGGIANELHWFKKWDKVLEWNHPWAKWFAGRPNQPLLQLSRPARCKRGARTKPRSSGRASRAKSARSPTSNCIDEVQKFANVLKSLGVKKGDRVAIYMGMTPELPIAMLACARIGAPHTVVFGGFSVECAGRPHSRLAGRRCHHAGRLVPSRR